MCENNISINSEKMHLSIWGFVYLDTLHKFYHIIINKNLTFEMQKKVLNHEKAHIKKHLPEHPYIIGLDMKHIKIEKEADKIANEIIKSL